MTGEEHHVDVVGPRGVRARRRRSDVLLLEVLIPGEVVAPRELARGAQRVVEALRLRLRVREVGCQPVVLLDPFDSDRAHEYLRLLTNHER